MKKQEREIRKLQAEKAPAIEKARRTAVTRRQPNTPRRYVPSGRKGKR